MITVNAWKVIISYSIDNQACYSNWALEYNELNLYPTKPI